MNEAAYTSLPLIFADPAISQIAEDKVTGILAKPNGEAFAKAVQQLMSSPTLTKKYGTAAHQRALTLTIDHQAKALEDIYQNAIEHHVSYESVL